MHLTGKQISSPQILAHEMSPMVGANITEALMKAWSTAVSKGMAVSFEFNGVYIRVDATTNGYPCCGAGRGESHRVGCRAMSIERPTAFRSNRPCDMMGHDFTSPEAMLYKRCSKCNWSMDSWEDFPDQRAACQGAPLPEDFGAWRHTCHKCRHHWHSMSEDNTCPRCNRDREALGKFAGEVGIMKCDHCLNAATRGVFVNGAWVNRFCDECAKFSGYISTRLQLTGVETGLAAYTCQKCQRKVLGSLNGVCEDCWRAITKPPSEHIPNLWPKDKVIAEIEARGPMPKRPFVLGERLRIKATDQKLIVWRIDKDGICCLVESGALAGAILRYSPDDLERYQIVMDTATTAGSIATSTISAEGDPSGNAKFLNDMACPNHWTGGLTGVCPDCGKK